MSLTDTTCRTAKPADRAYKLSDAGGLYLEVTPSGSKLWRLKYRFFGIEKRLAIGKYPDISLLKAREARESAKVELRDGRDPSAEKQERKRLKHEASDNSFQAISRKWHEKNKSGWSENHASTVLRRLEHDLFPALGVLPISEITTSRISTVIETIERRGAAEAARRSLQYCRSIFAYARVKGFVDSNPADIKPSDILKPMVKGHFAAIDSRQLPEFLGKLYRNEGRAFIQTQLAAEFLMLTMVRTNEMINAQWKEIDFEKKEWLIPAHRMKMKKEHIVPLSKQVLHLLEKLKNLNPPSDWIFPSRRTPKNHMSDNAVLVMLDRMGYRGLHTGHGFRALAMTTIMEELGYQYDIPNTQLAHSKGDDVRRAYDRTKFLKERKAMMQDWANYIDSVASSISFKGI